MRLVFLGTPAFAVATLEAVVEAGHEVAAVLTQPDRPRGRGQNAAASPVKQAALGLGLTVYQPERVRRPEAVEYLRGIGCDAMVVVGYGQIIPQVAIDLAPLGIINVHASLLPKYRGAGPIQWAIVRGETRTGVTTMRIDAGLDTGDMLLQAETGIGPEENAVELGERLAAMGADLLVETLEGLGLLLGTTTVQAVEGVVEFDDLSFSLPGVYVIQAKDGNYTATQSEKITLPSRLVFTEQPGLTAAGSMIGLENGTEGPIEVTLEDAAGIAVPINDSTVTLSLQGTPGGTLGGTTSMQVVNGVATYSDLSITK